MLSRTSHHLFLCLLEIMHIGWLPWNSFVSVLFLMVCVYVCEYIYTHTHTHIHMFLPLHSHTSMDCYVDPIHAVPINLSVPQNVKTKICCDWVADWKLCLFPWIHLEADLAVDCYAILLWDMSRSSRLWRLLNEALLRYVMSLKERFKVFSIIFIFILGSISLRPGSTAA
jgi:hypothetical protein